MFTLLQDYKQKGADAACEPKALAFWPFMGKKRARARSAGGSLLALTVFGFIDCFGRWSILLCVSFNPRKLLGASTPHLAQFGPGAFGDHREMGLVPS